MARETAGQRAPGMRRDPAEREFSRAVLAVELALENLMTEHGLTHAGMLYALAKWSSSVLAGDVARERQHG